MYVDLCMNFDIKGLVNCCLFYTMTLIMQTSSLANLDIHDSVFVNIQDAA